eukprot:TRINITY_DN5235_c0_g2_i1.p1 TRINITY_DN5235_c0_g2~~TRINITY_DN5235_c0_g2_i1.p1  ORF type:complete len:301 (+),score=26.83 TRINITY_DN5235_c0_g2_i1:218-1120(+)
MALAFGESVIISFDRSAADEKRLRRRRYLTWCLLSLPFLLLLMAAPGALKTRLLSSELASPERGRGATSAVAPPPNASILPLRSQTQWAPVLAIMAGYDNCWDSISVTNPMNMHKRSSFTRVAQVAALRLIRAVATVAAGRERVILFVGSVRQSVAVDRSLSAVYRNGAALGPNGAFEAWVARNKHRKWELNKALLADGSEPFSAWENSSKTYARARQEEIKVRIVENNLRHLQGLGPVDVYFFDALESHLDYVHAHAAIPSNINFHSVFYDAYSYGLGDGQSFMPIVGKDNSGRLWKLL